MTVLVIHPRARQGAVQTWRPTYVPFKVDISVFGLLGADRLFLRSDEYCGEARVSANFSQKFGYILLLSDVEDLIRLVYKQVVIGLKAFCNL